MLTTTTNRALKLILAALLSIPAGAAEPETTIILTGQAHSQAKDARRAINSCDFAKARRHVTAAQQFLKQTEPEAGSPAETVADELAALNSELTRRETLAARAEQDLATLVRNQAWREAEIRLATAASNGCTSRLEAYRAQVSKAVARPRGYAGPAAHAGSAVKTLMILGTIGGGGWIIQHRLRSRGIL